MGTSGTLALAKGVLKQTVVGNGAKNNEILKELFLRFSF